VNVRGRDARDWALLGRAWLGLMRSQYDLRRRPYRRLAEEAQTARGQAAGAASKSGAAGLEASRAAAVRAVGAAARVTIPPATCLPRALVLCRLLRESGLPAEVRIGVRRADETLQAHAWVELRGEVVGDRSDIAHTFKPLETGGDLPHGAVISASTAVVPSPQR